MVRHRHEAILIPVKRLDRAKLRLSELLTPADRRRLGLAMLADVLRATDKWQSRFLVTGDSDAEAVGLAFGCTLVDDPETDLNSALRAGTVEALFEDVDSLLILPSDVPLVNADDVAALFSYEEAVVLAPSRDGGTNALLRQPPDTIDTCFGRGSAVAHKLAADVAGATFLRVELDSLLLDVDSYSDLGELCRAPGERDSIRLARELIGRY